MNTPYIFTIIIPYRHRLDRFLNLKRVLDWALGFNGIEIIIVEHDSQTKLSDYSLRGFKHIFTKSLTDFNKSHALNIGIKNSSTNALVLCDADVIMDPEDFISALKKLEQFESVNPSKKIIYLGGNEVNMNLNDLKKLIRTEDNNESDNFCRGIVMFRKDALLRIGCFPEDFIGWGGEDDLQTFKVRSFLTHYECDFKSYHFPHQSEKINNLNYQRNLNLLQKLKELNKEDFTKWINNTKSKIMIKNR